MKVIAATATFKPKENAVAVSLSDGCNLDMRILTPTAARHLHAQLGVALHLAECRGMPLKAVGICNGVE